MPLTIERHTLIVVEGQEDRRFLQALIEQTGLPDSQVHAAGGKRGLTENVRALPNTPGFDRLKSLAVVRDANNDPHGAFQSVSTALCQAGLPMPKRPLELAGTAPRVGVMILPRPDQTGALEDLCLESVAEYPAAICVERYFDCLSESGVCLPRKTAKAKVHAFLASRPEPDKRLGEAAEAGYWPWDRPAFDELKMFLQDLVA